MSGGNRPPALDETVATADNSKVEELIAWSKEAAAIRLQETQIYREIFDYTMPNRRGFEDVGRGQRRDDLIYDETAVVGVQEFASRLQSGVVPPNVHWIVLRPAAGNNDPDKQTALEQVNAKIFEELGQSNFDIEVPEAFLDVAVGTAIFSMEDGGIDAAFRCQAMNPSEVSFLSGPFGDLDRMFRQKKRRLGDIQTVWPKAKLPADLTKKLREQGGRDMQVEILEVLHRDWAAKATETWRYSVIELSTKKEIYSTVYKGQGCCPWIPFRWSRLAGETWGRGPAYNALSAIKTLNLTIQLILENASMSIAGMWKVEDDGTINPDTIELVPGAVIPYGAGTAGMEPLVPGGRFDVAELVIEKMQHNVRKALYNETLGPREGTPASATEVQTRMADLARQMGSPVQRVLRDFAMRVYLRAAYILKARGDISLPEIDGRTIKMVLKSPLAVAADMDEFNNNVTYLNSMAALFPQEYRTLFHAERTARKLGRLMSVDSDIMMTKAERDRLMQQAAQTAAGAIEAGATPGDLIQGAKALAG